MEIDKRDLGVRLTAFNIEVVPPPAGKEEEVLRGDSWTVLLWKKKKMYIRWHGTTLMEP